MEKANRVKRQQVAADKEGIQNKYMTAKRTTNSAFFSASATQQLQTTTTKEMQNT